MIVEAEAGIDHLQQRRSALISAAFTGKIEVRGSAGSFASWTVKGVKGGRSILFLTTTGRILTVSQLGIEQWHIVRRTRSVNTCIKRRDRRSQATRQFEVDRIVALQVEAQSGVDHLRGGKLHRVDLRLQRFEQRQRIPELHRPDHPRAPRLQETLPTS